MRKCKLDNSICLCANCVKNAAYENCETGFCIYCFDCEEKGKSIHNVYVCTGFKPVESEEENA